MIKKESQQLIDCCLENVDAVYCVCNNHPEIKDIEARPGYNVLTLLSQTKNLLEQLKNDTAVRK